VLFDRAALPLSHQTLDLRVRPGPRPPQAARIGVAQGQPRTAGNAGAGVPEQGRPFAEVGAGFAVSTTTCWRYVNEVVELLAGRAPKLRDALRKAKRQGLAYVVIDGTLIPIDRSAADRPFYSGEHKMHGSEPAGDRLPGRDDPVGVRRPGTSRRNSPVPCSTASRLGTSHTVFGRRLRGSVMGLRISAGASRSCGAASPRSTTNTYSSTWENEPARLAPRGLTTEVTMWMRASAKVAPSSAARCSQLAVVDSRDQR
jgi:hypothetical protein